VPAVNPFLCNLCSERPRSPSSPPSRAGTFPFQKPAMSRTQRLSPRESLGIFGVEEGAALEQLSGGERREKAYEKHAWIIFLVIGIFQLVTALGSTFTAGEVEWSSRFQSITGTTWDSLKASSPSIFKFIALVNTEGGILRVTLAILFIGISLKSYRKGERWAWYLFWLSLVALTANLGVNEIYGVSIVGFFAPFFVLYLLGLLLPYRKFFPKKAVSG